MRNIKSIFAAVLALCMLLCLCACGGDSETTTAGGKETTAATTTPAVTDETTVPADDGKVTYSVTVVDEDGNPIAGAMVQMCLDTCLPGMTNESGVAEFTLEEAEYKVSFLTMPAGYTYSTEEEAFYFADGSYEMTITLKAAE